MGRIAAVFGQQVLGGGFARGRVADFTAGAGGAGGLQVGRVSAEKAPLALAGKVTLPVGLAAAAEPSPLSVTVARQLLALAAATGFGAQLSAVVVVASLSPPPCSALTSTCVRPWLRRWVASPP